MKKGILLIGCLSTIVLASVFTSEAQPTANLTLETCHELARSNYPLIKQQELIKQTGQYSLSNIASGYYPQIALYGQATYQSDVTAVPVKLPGIGMEAPEKDQYKIYGEVSQLIYDGGMLKQRKRNQQTLETVENQKLETELYALKERINQLYFGILILDEQLAQTTILKSDLKAGMDRASAAVSNGVALKSSLDLLHAEELKVRQREIELRAARWSYVQMLGQFIRRPLEPSVKLEKPAVTATESEIRRPELALFDAQSKIWNTQERLIASGNRPRIHAFFQGGYGRPGLNMLSNAFDTYYVGGVRLQWNLSGFYTIRKEKQLMEINRRNNDIKRETFLFNTRLAVTQQDGELSKLNQLIDSDEEIILIRERIKNTAAAQLENGVITSGDFIREVNALDMARQNKILHELQKIMTMYQYQNITGN